MSKAIVLGFTMMPGSKLEKEAIKLRRYATSARVSYNYADHQTGRELDEVRRKEKRADDAEAAVNMEKNK